MGVLGAGAGPIQVFGHRFVMPVGVGTTPYIFNRVLLVDIGSGGRRIVAHSGWARGLINWAVGSGDWVAWVDQSRQQNDFSYDVLWRVWAENLVTGRQRLLASNGGTPDPYVPQVLAGGGFFYWAQADRDRTAQELVWKPGSPAAPRTLLRHTQMTPGTETVSDGMLTYLGSAGMPHTGHTVGGDCWTVPLTGGRPRALTHTALAMGCATSNGWLVWSQHIDPGIKHPPPDGIVDDPWSYWSMPTSGGTPRLLHRGYTSSGYPDAGNGYAIWSPRDAAFTAHAVDSNAHLPIGPGRAFDAAVGSSIGDGFFAYAPGSSLQRPMVIHVVRITVG